MNVLIIGGGQVGSYICSLLLNSECNVKIVEKRASVLEKLQKELPPEALVIGGGTDTKALKIAGIETADVVVAVTGADEINLVASTIAKYEFGVPRVIARVNNPKNDWLFNVGMGVDVKFNQADILAHLVVDEIDLKNMVTLMKLNRGENSIIQVSVASGSVADGNILRTIDVPEGIVLIAVHRGEQIILPHGDTTLEAGDHVLLLADAEGQKCAHQLFGQPQ